jgi:uncharacterized RDD family membrane protein YckC
VAVCTQCGLDAKSALRCERCGTVLARADLQLAVPAAVGAPAPSATLNQELPLDRRTAPRPISSAPASVSAPVRTLPVPNTAAEPAPAFFAPPTTPAPVAAPAPVAQVAQAPAVKPRGGDIEVVRATPAALGVRLAAWLVDGAVIGVVLFLYLKVAQAVMHHPPPPTTETGLDWLVNRVDAYHGVLKYGLGLAAALSFVYSSLFHALGGMTPGKRLFGVKLVDRTGKPPSLGRCALRSALALVSGAALFLGFIMALFDRRRQALHDKLTFTYVVKPLS